MRGKLCLALMFLAIALSSTTCLMSPAWGQNLDRTTEEHKVMLGAFMGEIRGRGANQQNNNEANLEAWESKIGHSLAFQLSYYGPGNLTAEKLASDGMIQGDLRYHRIPYISYRCETALENYINGSQDALLDQTAAALSSTKRSSSGREAGSRTFSPISRI
jgi:hypothetical protein